VIGNSAYTSIGALKNPAADARLIARTLGSLGFETTLLLDADQGLMKQRIAEFGRRLRAEGPSAVGLFYYAGHGIQAHGANYLIPVEAALTDAADLDLMAVEANWVLRQMESARNDTNIVILDACRNNPFVAESRAVDQGLARIDAPTGSFIAYATAPGAVALDGDAVNSPFSLALANAMPAPGRTIEQVFKQVRIDVLRATQGQQTPWDSSSMVREFFFNPAPAVEEVRPVELRLWQSVSKSKDPGRLALFLQVYPNSRFAPEARALLAEAVAANPALVTGGAEASRTAAAPKQSEHEMIAAAQATQTVEAYRAYLDAYPNGVFADLAKAELAYLQSTAAPAATGPAPAAPAAPAPAGQAVAALEFDQPISEGEAPVAGRSIHELAMGSPEFPPVEGLDAAYWQGRNCSNCHNWTRESLCQQGTFYTGQDAAAVARIKHPYGGAFKKALRAWAEAGCP